MGKVVSIQVEINGFKGAVSDADSLKKAIRATNKELDQVEFGTAKYKRLQDQLGGLRAVQKQVRADTRKSQQAFEAAAQSGTGSYRALNAQLVKLRATYKDLSEADRRGRLGQGILKDIGRLDKQLKKLDSDIGHYQRNVGNYASAFRNFGNAITGGLLIGGIAEVGQAVRSTIDTFREFSQAVATLGAISGATGPELKALEADARRIGETSQFTATQVVELQTALARLGFSSREILQATEPIANLSIATGEAIEESAKVIGQSIRAYGLDASEAGRVADVLAASFNSSALQLETFAEASKLLAPVSRSLGVSIEESTAAIGLLADNGLEGTIATQTLRTAFQRLADDSKTYGQVAKEAGVEVFNQQGQFVGLTQFIKNLTVATEGLTEQERLATLTRIVGQQAAGNFAILLNGTKNVVTETGEATLQGADALAAYTAELENAEGQAKATADIVGDTLSQDLLKAQSAIEGLQLNLVELGNNGLRSIVQGFTGFISFISANIQPAFKAIGDALQPVREAFGRLFAAISITKEQSELLSNGALTILRAALSGIANGVAIVVNGFALFIEALRAVPQFVEENKVSIGLLATGLIALNAAQIASAATALRTAAAQKAAAIAANAATIATNVLAGAQRILNIVLSANPIGIIITGLGILATALTTAYRRSETFRAGIAGLGAVASEVFSVIKEAVGAFVSGFNQLREGNIREGLRLFGQGIVKSNPVGIALSQGKRLGEAFTRGYAESIESESIAEVDAISGDSVAQAASDSGKKAGAAFGSGLEEGVSGTAAAIFGEGGSAAKQISDGIEGITAQISRLEKELEGENDESEIRKKLVAIGKLKQQLEDTRAEVERIRQELDTAGAVTDVIAPDLGGVRGQIGEVTSLQRESIRELTQLEADREAQRRQSYFQTLRDLDAISSYAVDVVGQASGAIDDLITSSSNRRINRLEDQYEAEIALAEGNEEEQARLQEELDEKRKEIEQQAFERGKRLAILSAVINGAQAVVSTLAAVPGPTDILSLGALRAIQIGIVTATTAAQIAAISSQQFEGAEGLLIPSMAEGGSVTMHSRTKGRTHASGHIYTSFHGQPVKVENGEFVTQDETGAAVVINRRSSDQHLGLLRRISKKRFPGKRALLSAINVSGGGIPFAEDGAMIQPNLTGFYRADAAAAPAASSARIVFTSDQMQMLAQAVASGAMAGTEQGVVNGSSNAQRMNERRENLQSRIS